MKIFSVVTTLIAVLLLCFIAYNSGSGKTIPVHHPEWMSCDGLLTRNLFYSSLLNDIDQKELAEKVKNANSTDEINNMVTMESNIDANKTKWYESISESGKCKAQIFLKNPNKEGNNTTYLEFEIGGFAQAGANVFDSIGNRHVLQSIHLNSRNGNWFKQ